MRGVGFEPTRIASRELESRALTARPSSRSLSFGFRQGEEITCLLQDMGFEPMRIAPPRPQRGPLTSWVILLGQVPMKTNKQCLRVAVRNLRLLGLL